MPELNSQGRAIGVGHPPFMVAEMSGDDNQSINRALEFVNVVSNAGADAIKLQTYTADRITLDVLAYRISSFENNHLLPHYQRCFIGTEWS